MSSLKFLKSFRKYEDFLYQYSLFSSIFRIFFIYSERLEEKQTKEKTKKIACAWYCHVSENIVKIRVRSRRDIVQLGNVIRVFGHHAVG